ncbi:MAG: glycosyltransferase, partial [Formivibrio sp.]|nr:glycosyltransferase [Formivibrio sp.]
MRSLLSVNNYHYIRGGSETVYFSHAEMFAAHGWETSFFSMHHEQNVPCADSRYFVDCIDYEKRGAEGRTISNALKIVYSLEARQKLTQLLDDKKINFAHIHSIYHHLSPSVLMELKARGIPAVMTAHDLKLACPNNKMLNRTGVCERCKGGHVWNAVRHRCIKDSFVASSLVALESAVHKMFGLYRHNLERVVAPSRFYRDKLISWGFDPNWIVHIPNPVALPLAPIAPPGNYILYFGRFAPEKGLVTLVRAAAHAKVPIRLVGRGPQEA